MSNKHFQNSSIRCSSKSKFNSRKGSVSQSSVISPKLFFQNIKITNQSYTSNCHFLLSFRTKFARPWTQRTSNKLKSTRIYLDHHTRHPRETYISGKHFQHSPKSKFNNRKGLRFLVARRFFLARRCNDVTWSLRGRRVPNERASCEGRGARRAPRALRWTTADARLICRISWQPLAARDRCNCAAPFSLFFFFFFFFSNRYWKQALWTTEEESRPQSLDRLT